MDPCKALFYSRGLHDGTLPDAPRGPLMSAASSLKIHSVFDRPGQDRLAERHFLDCGGSPPAGRALPRRASCAVLAVRYPGDLYAIDVDDQPDTRLLLIDDPSLLLADRMIDVIVGEVKQGPAKLNPAITRHEVLHHILGRLEWIYENGVATTVEDLQSSGSSESPGRSGAVIRTRLVAFGGFQGEPSLNTIPWDMYWVRSFPSSSVSKRCSDLANSVRPLPPYSISWSNAVTRSPIVPGAAPDTPRSLHRGRPKDRAPNHCYK